MKKTVIVMAALMALMQFAVAETRVQPDALNRDMLLSEPPPPYWLNADVVRGTSKTVKGSGLYLVKLNEKGWMTAGGVTRSTGNKWLDGSAVEWLRLWKFKPNSKVRYVLVPMSFSTYSDWNVMVRIPGLRQWTTAWHAT
jgi:hypothetical protein